MLTVAVAIAACLTACESSRVEPEAAICDLDANLVYCDQQVHRALLQLRDSDGVIDTSVMPRNIEGEDTAWACRELTAAEWCSGFWPGILWYDYEYSHDAEVYQAAVDATLAMRRIIDAPVFDHDLGFLMMCSAGTGLHVLEAELASDSLASDLREEKEALAAEFKDYLLRAADSLATLYRPNVGTILSWPRNIEVFGGHNTIMDNMINLEMLYWASKNGGKAELADIATRHATTTMQNHFRPDYTSYHVAVYDTLDGHFIKGVTHQGYADSSMWARGQSWAVYGFTMVYRETQNEAFLEQAQHVADVYIDRLPADKVPFWDFSDPRIPTSPDSIPAAPSETVAPRDASAAAVVASALIELSTLVPDTVKAQGYLDAAKSMLASLSSENYQSRQRNSAFLLHSVGNHPKQSEVDASIIYADYYYIEALTRLHHLQAQ